MTGLEILSKTKNTPSYYNRDAGRDLHPGRPGYEVVTLSATAPCSVCNT
jgi:hypothetical protein